MFKDIASVGDKLELMKINSQGTVIDETKRHVSVVYELEESDYASIAIPIENSRLIPLEIGGYYLVYIYSKGGLYVCKAKVLSRFRIQSAYAAQIQIISDLEKQQRRQFFRLDLVQDISYRVLTEEEWNEIASMYNRIFDRAALQEALEQLQMKNTYQWLDGVMIDISGGGLKFNSKEVCQENAIVQIKFILNSDNGQKKFLFFAKVVSCSEAKNLPNAYVKRLVFLKMRNEEREAIVRYIFDEERKRRSKENRLS